MSIIKIIGVLILGALGALLFVVFLLPYLLTSPSFENFQFVKDLKFGKIVVNQTDKVYIQENSALQDTIEKVKNSVVVIQSPVSGLVSGLIATSDGNIITLANVVRPNAKLFLNGQPLSFTVVKTDAKNNLALLKVEKNNLPTMALAEVNNIKLGQRVFLLGSTSIKQDNWFANEGMITEIDTDSMKTNITEKPAVIGGPLFNVAGELVGLNFINAEGKISAVPVDKIQTLLGL